MNQSDIFEKLESTAGELNIDSVKNEEILINLCNHLIWNTFTWGDDPVADEIVNALLQKGEVIEMLVVKKVIK